MSKFFYSAFIAVFLFALTTTAQAASPRTAAEHLRPVPRGYRDPHRVLYSDQFLTGTHLARARAGQAAALRAGTTLARPAGAATVTPGGTGAVPFLTRPYWNWHQVYSVFDHCNPDYSLDGKICEVDGTVALASNGSDPTFSPGYAITPGGTDYLYYDGHNGWDIGLYYEEVIAAAPGVVTNAGVDPNNPGYGLCVVINHPNGFSTRYAHMSQIDVTVGQQVNRGQKLGISGNTGDSTGPHLHFGLYVTSTWTAIDPWGWQGNYADPWPADQGDLWLTGNPQNPVPYSPQNVTASALGNAVTLKWQAPAFNGGDPITSYSITSSPSGASLKVPGTTTSAFITGLRPGTTYTFTVTASNDVGAGTSASSNAVLATTGTLTDLGGVLPSAPAATASAAANRIDVATQGLNDTVWDAYSTDGGKTYSWTNLGGSTPYAPTILSWPGHLEVFATWSNQVWHDWWNGSKWSGWTSLGGNAAGAPDASTSAPGHMDVVVRDPSGNLLHTWYAGAWAKTWETLAGGVSTDPAVVSSQPGQLEVFWRGNDQQLWHRYYYNHAWSGWYPLGGTLVGSPRAVSWGGGRVDVFVRGTDNALWHTDFQNGWGWWSSEGGDWTSDAGPAAISPGSVDLFVRGQNSALWEYAASGV